MSAIDDAKRVLGGKQQSTATELFRLGKALRGLQKFDLARRVFALAAARPEEAGLSRREILQKLASCTEKDPDLPLDIRFRRAQRIIQPVLEEAEAFLQKPAAERRTDDPTLIQPHQETFGIAAAMHKRWWQADAQIRHLVEAQDLYENGWRLAAEYTGPGLPDQGYTGINAAFVLDLLAQQVSEDRHLAAIRRERAQKIRTEIRAKLSALPAEQTKDWWTLVTLAEACFGLREYEQADAWLTAAAKNPPKEPWEYETTVKQLARLATLQQDPEMPAEQFAKTEAWRVLQKFVGGDDAGLLTAFSGKVGLALSGGGFRASIFHLGVLARLAELDMLRHVEVISCVSGGSIIGALYYLKLRALLQGAADRDIQREHYIALVQEMERQFMAAIQGNPRMQVFSQVTRLGQRTEDMGALLDATLYGPIFHGAAGQREGAPRPLLRELKIRPPKTAAEVPLEPGQRSAFSPKLDNWRRRNKAPILIINATTLNTGHNWQFTATFMGESPNQIVPEVDGNERLRRMYFDEPMPGEHRDVPLGRAVAASAAVPALFCPVKLRGLYPDRDVELVDGGVHDNQGVAGLREQDCTVLLISDACGQLVAEAYPSRGEVPVIMRSNDTLMARVRELEYKELTARRQAGLLRDFMFVHLKKELTVEPVDWIDCDLAKDASDREGVAPESAQPTRYGVRGDVQNLLSGIRTDLDVFCEGEAFALMASGYRMTKWDFPRSITSFEASDAAEATWRFNEVGSFLGSAGETPEASMPENFAEFVAVLKLAGKKFFKGPHLIPNMRWVKLLLLAALSVAALVPIVVIAAGVLWLLWQVPWVLLLVGLWLLALAVPTYLLVRGHLYRLAHYFDGFYLSKGTLQNLRRPAPKEGT